MNKNYLIIDKKVLPDYFEKVITAKEYVAGGMSVVEAVELSVVVLRAITELNIKIMSLRPVAVNAMLKRLLFRFF